MTKLEYIIAEVDQLSEVDRERLKAYLAAQPAAVQSPGEAWLARLDAALDYFWGDTPEDERAAIIEAINTKGACSLPVFWFFE